MNRDIEDGMGFSGLVESSEERRERQQLEEARRKLKAEENRVNELEMELRINEMEIACRGLNKFDAARLYNNGFKFALLREPVSVDFATQHPLWRRGYTFGLSIKKQFWDNRNASLIDAGIEPIHEMILQ